MTGRLTDPPGHTTALARDSLSRIIAVTDLLNRTTSYDYDARGLLASVSEPVVGAATYGRDALGNLARISDLNGQRWDFAYTPVGRPVTQTAPLGRAWRYAYDARGRLAQITFPDDVAASLFYDAASNITRTLYSGGPDHRFAYDALDRLVATYGITLTYDAVGRVTGATDPATAATFGATYDAAGRLKTVNYDNDAFSVAYTYDPATGLLTRVRDSLTGSQVDFTYDADLRLTGISRSNGVHTTLTWDDAGGLTRIRDGNVTDLQYTLDAAGQVVALQMTAPLDPDAYLVRQVANLSYDAALQINSPGYAYDARGRLIAAAGATFTWDGASRLVGVGQDVSLSYNGLDDLVSRAEGFSTTHYYHNYALGLAPMVAEAWEQGSRGAEAQESGEASRTTQYAVRYYVYTPSGSLLYAIDAAAGNAVFFYHFDRTGSTLALTDGSGMTTDAYAYDPYGQLLAHTGSSNQPFTFVGQWGVRQEGTSGALYQMRARYYDATTVRFLSRDPIWPNLTDPLQLNPYSYARINPVNYADPSGKFLSLAFPVARTFTVVLPKVGKVLVTLVPRSW